MITEEAVGPEGGEMSVEDAEPFSQESADITITDVPRMVGLGLVAYRRGDHRVAARAWKTVFDLFPFECAALTELSRAYIETRRYHKSLHLMQRCLLVDPGNPAYNMEYGRVARLAEQYRDALQAFRRGRFASAEDDSVKVMRSLTLLKVGDWNEGLALYERRESNRTFQADLAAVGKDVWAGEPLDGKRVLIMAEQGHGDTINFIRYATALKRAGASEVSFTGMPAIRPLIAKARNVDRVVDGISVDQFDYGVLTCSLPLRFNASLKSAAYEGPYLECAPRSEVMPAGRGPVIGLCWRGNPQNSRDALRSVPDEAIRAFADVPGVRFVSLVNRPAASPEVLRDFAHDLSPEIGDFADLGSLVAACDLVISVDTAVGHLAGAMGRNVWMILGEQSDWRWGNGSDRTAWYRSMRLYRQPNGQQWEPTIEKIAEDLRNLKK